MSKVENDEKFKSPDKRFYKILQCVIRIQFLSIQKLRILSKSCHRELKDDGLQIQIFILKSCFSPFERFSRDELFHFKLNFHMDGHNIQFLTLEC